LYKNQKELISTFLLFALRVENLLNVTISGSGNVYYIGNPQINVTISGSGGIYNSN